MMLVKKLLLLVCFSALMSCSGTYRAYTDMLTLAFTPTLDVQLPYAAFTSAKHDYLYVKYGKQAQVAMALMFIEQGQLKWVSADRVVLITEQGRIVRTIGLENDLLHLSNTAQDPLKQQFGLNNTSPWLRLADWQQHEYGYQLRSTFQYGPAETMLFFGQGVAVIPLIENVQYDNTANFVRFDDKWQNQFWLEAKSGVVLKSRQMLAPGAEPFELTFISEVVRQLQRNGIAVAADAI
jgi:hypothetical protein